MEALKHQIMTLLGATEEGSELCEYALHHKLLGGTLPHAILAGNRHFVRELIVSYDVGADQDGPDCVDFASLAGERDMNGATALAVAAFVGEADILHEMMSAESLRELGRPRGWDDADAEGMNLICIAARRGHAQVVSVLALAHR